ncbi:MAG: hypothetical protein HRU15_15595, partial [Planctomycetes bacterium]|nr:hypothetical protein [Planctomycetota bacterium]
DKIKPNRLGASTVGLTFDGVPLNIYEALSDLFPANAVAFRTPVFSLHSGSVKIDLIQHTVFANPFVVEDLGSTFGFGGFVLSSYITLVRRAQKLINRPDFSEMLHARGIFDTMSTLYDSGIFVTVEPIGVPLWDKLSRLLQALNEGNLERAIALEQMSKGANEFDVQAYGVAKDVLTAIQPDNVLLIIFKALSGNPLLIIAIVVAGAAIYVIKKPANISN